MPLLLKEDQPPQGVQTAPAPVPTQSPEYKEWLHSCPDYMHHTPSKEGASSAVGRLCGSELPPGLQVDRGAALSKRESPRSVGLHAIQAAAASALAHLSAEAADTPQVLQVAKRHAVGSDLISVAPNATIMPATKQSPAGASGLRSAVTCTDFVPGPSINSLLTSTSATSLRSCTSGAGDSKAFAPPAVNAPSQQRPGSPAAGQAGSIDDMLAEHSTCTTVATCLAGTSRAALPSQCRPMSSALKAEQASELLHDTLLSLPRSSDALLQTRTVLQILRELQVLQTAGASSTPSTRLNEALAEAMQWALKRSQEISSQQLAPTVLENLIFACLVLVNMRVAHAEAGASNCSNIALVKALVEVMKAGATQAKLHAAVVLSQVVLEGASIVEALLTSQDFVHNCTMLVCSEMEDAKSEAALLLNNLAALASEDLQCILAGNAALVNALKNLVEKGCSLQQCRSSGTFMHLSKNARPRAMLQACCVDEALAKIIQIRLEDLHPLAEQLATLGLSSMAFINLSHGHTVKLPLCRKTGSREPLVGLLLEILLSAVQQRALFGIQWRLKDILWSLRVLAGDFSYHQMLGKRGLIQVISMITERTSSGNGGQCADDVSVITRLAADIRAYLTQSSCLRERNDHVRQSQPSRTDPVPVKPQREPVNAAAIPDQSARRPTGRKEAGDDRELQLCNRCDCNKSMLHRVLQHCVKRVDRRRARHAFFTWISNIRDDPTFLDSKLYTKLVAQLAKERVRVVHLEKCLAEQKQEPDQQNEGTSTSESARKNPRHKLHRSACKDTAGPGLGGRVEEATMDSATTEVNAAVGKVVEVLHSEVSEREGLHKAIMTAIANTIASRCLPPPSSPTPNSAADSLTLSSSLASSKMKLSAISPPHEQTYIIEGKSACAPASKAMTSDTGSEQASGRSTPVAKAQESHSSSHDFESCKSFKPLQPSQQIRQQTNVEELEMRHSSLMVLSAKTVY